MADIDINLLRGVVTLLSFASFVAIVVWALARRNKDGFVEAAQLPFAGDAEPAAAAPSSNRSQETRDE